MSVFYSHSKIVWLTLIMFVFFSRDGKCAVKYCFFCGDQDNTYTQIVEGKIKHPCGSDEVPEVCIEGQFCLKHEYVIYGQSKVRIEKGCSLLSGESDKLGCREFRGEDSANGTRCFCDKDFCNDASTLQTGFFISATCFTFVTVVVSFMD